MNRRTFLIRGTSFLAVGAALPAVLQRAVFAGTLDGVTAATGSKTLVVVQLEGGIDGLNTVIPYGDANYRTLRPTIGAVADAPVTLDDRYALHPSLAPLKAIWDAGKLAIVHGVGYPNPDLSHFKSMAIWHTADPRGTPADGWLGKCLQPISGPVVNPLAGFAQGTSLPASLRSVTTPVAVVESVAAYKLQSSYGSAADATKRQATLQKLYAAYPADAPYGLLLEGTADSALTSSTALQAVDKTYQSGTTYPGNGFANGLKLIAEAITTDLGVRVAYIKIGGWDTHSGENAAIQRLLTTLADGLKAFYDDLAAKGRLSDVLVMTWSEFGRRAKENASGGTDHGTANVQFLFGGSVRGGHHGAAPSLTSLDGNGNFKFSTDFRSTYATALGGWLGVDPAPVLGGSYPTLPLLDTALPAPPTSPAARVLLPALLRGSARSPGSW